MKERNFGGSMPKRGAGSFLWSYITSFVCCHRLSLCSYGFLYGTIRPTSKVRQALLLPRYLCCPYFGAIFLLQTTGYSRRINMALNQEES